MRYLIVPAAEEIEQWNFSSDVLLARHADDKPTICRYNLDTFQALTTLPADAVLCYKDHGNDLQMQSKNRQKLRQLVDDADRVFRHFGKWNINQMSLYSIQEKTKTWGDGWHGKNVILPYSIQSGDEAQFPWLPILTKVREKYGSESFDNLRSELDRAWICAESVFIVEKPMRKLLEALFPLFITHSTNGVNQEDVDAAIQAAQRLVESAEFKPTIAGIRLLTGSQDGSVLKEALDPQSDLSDPSRFLAWYRTLSEAYSKRLVPSSRVRGAQ